MNINNQTILQTKRLRLRPFRQDDFDILVQLFTNLDFMRFSLGPMTREQIAAFLDKVQNWERTGLPFPFGVIAPDGVLIGYCGFLHQEVDGQKEIEIGYRLHPDYWNRGFATEAARAVRDHAFRDLKLARVISLIHPDNTASRRVAEKNGMMLERTTFFKSFPTQVFAITQAQWQALTGA